MSQAASQQPPGTQRTSVAIPDFWRLLVESRLFSAADAQQLRDRFSGVKGATQTGNARTLAEWLVAEQIISRYQSKVLLSGRPGPFVYGDYTLVDRLIGGRLTGLFKAVHTPTRHSVLLSFLSGQALQSPQSYANTVAQIAVACQANHPTLSQTNQLVDLGTFKFIVLEELPGKPASDFLAAGKRLGPADACRMTRQAALGLHVLHSLSVAHGDVRADNLWIDSRGNARLLQLPLSREPHLPPSGLHGSSLSGDALLAAADYFAPELNWPDQRPDALTDIYSLGCLLFQLLSGRAPFSGGDLAGKIQRHATELPPSLDSFGAPSALSQVIGFMMAKDRNARYQTTAQLADALAYFVEPSKVNDVAAAADSMLPVYDAWRRTQPLVPSVVYPAAASPEPPATEWSFPPPNGSTFDRGFNNSGALGEPQLSLAPIAGRPVLSSATIAEKRRRQSRNNAIIGGAALALILAIGLIVGFGVNWSGVPKDRSLDNVATTSPETQPAIARPRENGTADPTGEKPPVKPGPNDFNPAIVPKPIDPTTSGPTKTVEPKTAPTLTIADDGKALWASPTSGPPLTLSHLPPLVQMVLAMRPAELTRHPEGERVIAALGPYGTVARNQFEATTSFKLADIEQLLVGWTLHEKVLVPTFVIRPLQPITVDALAAKLPGAQTVSHGSGTFLQTASAALYLPPAENGKVLVVGQPAQIKQILDGGMGLLARREMVKLLSTTDSQRMVTLMFPPAFLVDEGRGLFAGGLQGLVKPTEWFFGDSIRAAALSVHFTSVSYMELRLVGTLDKSASGLAKDFDAKIRESAGHVENYVSSLTLPAYSRKLLFRFPEMVKYLKEQLRVEADDDQTVLNWYLPAVAPHNLVMGTELALADQGGTAVGVTSNPATSPTASGAIGNAATEKLKKKISLMFPRETLEKSMQLISEEVGVPIEIVGTDLQLDGITKNQSFGLEEKDKPADEILRNIMLKANPDGKLVYVIKPKQAGGEDMIFITTRAAVAKRGDKLPPELVAPAGKAAPGNNGKK